ncbi:DUF5133 domain-containing protein [Streptomyces sp. B1I3]|uniref:DUF5133 domain-containing protein n=1 Tax=Streptomyces sp. B1I3 TaxID=3042264 RepID=UPI0027D86110|nr:DUF5133 domain-containing protein [Streptomyces sp. B1I3]
MPHPTILRGLVERYAALSESSESAGGLEDISYTLCVSTGTRNIEDALAVAERYLDEALAGEGLKGGVLTGETTDPGAVTLTA